MVVPLASKVLWRIILKGLFRQVALAFGFSVTKALGKYFSTLVDMFLYCKIFPAVSVGDSAALDKEIPKTKDDSALVVDGSLMTGPIIAKRTTDNDQRISREVCLVRFKNDFQPKCLFLLARMFGLTLASDRSLISFATRSVFGKTPLEEGDVILAPGIIFQDGDDLVGDEWVPSLVVESKGDKKSLRLIGHDLSEEVSGGSFVLFEYDRSFEDFVDNRARRITAAKVKFLKEAKPFCWLFV